MKRVNEGRRRDGERKGQIGAYNLGGRDVIGLSGGGKLFSKGTSGSSPTTRDRMRFRRDT